LALEFGAVDEVVKRLVRGFFAGEDEPAFDGVALAILFFGAVLLGDELRRQRRDLGMPGRRDGRRQP